MLRFAFPMIALALLLVPVAPASAVTIFGSAMLTGDQEVPPAATTASGTINFVLDDTTGLLSLSGTVTGISKSDITFSAADPSLGGLAFGNAGPFHIHNGPAGVNGPIVTPFPSESFYTDTATGLSIEATDIPFDLAFRDTLLAGDMYFNLHTGSFPGGEIRGQIQAAIPEPTSALLFALGIGAAVLRGRRRPGA